MPAAPFPITARLRAALARAQALWLARRTRCRHCGYDLRGLTTPRCPECATPIESAPLARDGRYHLRSVVLFATAAGPLVALPWIGALAGVLLIMRTTSAYPPRHLFALAGSALLAFTLGALALLLRIATARTTVLYHACIRYLVSAAAMITAAYLTWALAWRLWFGPPFLIP